MTRTPGIFGEVTAGVRTNCGLSDGYVDRASPKNLGLRAGIDRVYHNFSETDLGIVSPPGASPDSGCHFFF
jgi:hypothetical protein